MIVDLCVGERCGTDRETEATLIGPFAGWFLVAYRCLVCGRVDEILTRPDVFDGYAHAYVGASA